MNTNFINNPSLNAPALSVSNLSVTYSIGGAMDERQGIKSLIGLRRKLFPVLNKISFSIEFEAGIATIIGPNGVGKTTLLRAVSGIMPSSGDIKWNGQKVNHLTSDKLATLGITFVPHDGGIFNNLSVRDHLSLASSEATNPNAVLEDLYIRLREKNPMLDETVGFLKRRGKAGNLSGGERKILSLVRLLFKKWSLVLIDEPTAGLSPKMVDTCAVIIETLKPACVLTVEQYSRADTMKQFGAQLYELREDGIRTWQEE